MHLVLLLPQTDPARPPLVPESPPQSPPQLSFSFSFSDASGSPRELFSADTQPTGEGREKQTVLKNNKWHFQLLLGGKVSKTCSITLLGRVILVYISGWSLFSDLCLPDLNAKALEHNLLL